MEKKNSEGKTFGDIFSKVSSDMKKQDDSVKNVSKEEDNKTFNSIFDSNSNKVDENNDKKSFSDIFSKLEDDKNSDEVDTNPFIDNEDKNDDEKSFSDIFSKDSNEVKTDVEIDAGSEDDESVSLTSGDDESFGDIFSKEEEVNLNNQEESTVSVSEDSDSEKVLEDDFNKDNEEVNKDIEVNDSVSESDSDDLEKVDSNIFFGEEKQDVSENMEVQQPLKNDDGSIFFATDNGKESEETVDNDSVVEKSSLVEKEDNLKEEDSTLEKEVSPFFEKEEEPKNEGNPFFDNKISLMENKKFSNNDKNGKIDVSKVQNFDVKIRKKKPNLVQAIIGVLSYALFIWLLLVGVALLVYVLDVKIRAAKGDTSPPKYGAYVVLTGSMLPEIQVYDVVITKKQDAKDLKEGDVITFASADTRFAGTIITHRIIKKNYSAKTKSFTFQTKGDNNNVADSALVTPSNIYGKVILRIPKLGYLRDFLASDGGWILVILFPCLAVVSYDIVKIAKGLRKKKYNNLKVQSR